MNETYFVQEWIKNADNSIVVANPDIYYKIHMFCTVDELLRWISKNKETKFTVYVANRCPLDWS
jgi:hypothetical protein